MTDRKLLEAAAKAAGMRIGYEDDCWFQTSRDGDVAMYSAGRPATWNPLTDDGDALRLAVKLGFLLRWGLALDTKAPLVKVASYSQLQFVELVGEHTDAAAATRRAIVRAAAAIGSLHNAGADAA